VTGRWPGGLGCRGCRRTRRGGPSKGARRAKCKLAPAQLRQLETVLDAGPATSGWDEHQCWTLVRIAEEIRSRFTVDYTPVGLTCYCTGSGGAWRCRRQAAERDEARITCWRHRRQLPGRQLGPRSLLTLGDLFPEEGTTPGLTKRLVASLRFRPCATQMPLAAGEVLGSALE
jgi:transposase